MRQFEVAEPNLVWAADMTFIKTTEGWLYLAVVLDLYSRKIVGWSMGSRMTAELPLAALRMAFHQRHPAPGLMHHSDRGSQGGFKWSSQQQHERRVALARRLRWVSATRAPYGVWR